MPIRLLALLLRVRPRVRFTLLTIVAPLLFAPDVGAQPLPPGIPALPSDVTRDEVNGAARESGFPESEYPYASVPNGCGSGPTRSVTPQGVDGISFVPACESHDRCYVVGSRKEACDHAFLRDLTQICYAQATAPGDPPVEGRASRDDCLTWARRFYAAVDELGGDAFEDAQSLQEAYGRWLHEYLEILSVLYVFDTSGSMLEGNKHLANRISALNSLATIKFVQSSRPRRRAISVMTFGGDCSEAAVKTLADFTPDLDRIESVLENQLPWPAGGTPLTIARARAARVAEAFKRTDPQYIKKVKIVVMSDGEDTCGEVRPQGAYSRPSQLAGDESHVQYLTIGFDVAAGSRAERDLQYLAASSGGRYVSARDPGQLSRAFERLLTVYRPRPSPGVDSVPAEARATFRQGIRALYDRDYPKARDAFRAYVAAQPRDPAGVFNLATALEASEQYRGAADAYQRYTSLAPGARDRSRVLERIPRMRANHADHFAYQVELVRSDLAYLENYYERLFNQDNASLAAEFRGFVREKGEFYASLSDALEIEAPWVEQAERDVGQALRTLARRVDSPTFDRDAVSLLAVPIGHLEELVQALAAHRPTS